MKLVGSLLVFLAFAGLASASFPTAPVPEIDGSSVAAGIGLVSGAFLIMRGRNRR